MKHLRVTWVCPLSVLLVGLLLAGCQFGGGPGPFFDLSPSSNTQKALQTRLFDTSREGELLSASVAVLQDIGFQVEEVARETGFLFAAKERGAREYLQEMGRAFVFLVGLAGLETILIPVDMHQQIASILWVSPVEGEANRSRVRIVFYRKIWKGDGNTGDQYIPPGRQRMEMIYDARIYQRFFAKLSKAIFLEAHQI